MINTVFRVRRKRLMDRMKEGVALFLAPPVGPSVYRTSGDLLYLTGLNEPSVALVLVAGARPRSHLFLLPHDRLDEVWNGRRAEVEDGPKTFGVDEVHSFKDLESKLTGWLAGQRTLWAALGEVDVQDQFILRLMKQLRTSKRGGVFHLPVLREVGTLVHEMRWVKDREELTLMRQAARVTASGYREALKTIRPHLGEKVIEGVLHGRFRGEEGGSSAFDPIVGSGENSCYLHYRKNEKIMKAGELVVIDSGVECGFYCSDVTRTYPVSGRFTPLQARVYDTVLKAQLAAIRRCRPGATHSQVGRAALEVLVRGLIRLGAIKDRTVQSAMKKKSYEPFYPHGIGHWLGVYVHDVGPYTYSDGSPAKLRPGVVLTVEPGLYFSPRERRTPKALRGIGVRIEDDVLITSSGHEVLTKDIPKTRKEIEAAMGRY